MLRAFHTVGGVARLDRSGDTVITWIMASSNLPDADTIVLVYCPRETEPVQLAFLEDEDAQLWLTPALKPIYVQCWAELPEPPEVCPCCQELTCRCYIEQQSHHVEIATDERGTAYDWQLDQWCRKHECWVE
jgi:hypothetical protein